MKRILVTVGMLAGLLCIAPSHQPAHADVDSAKAELLALHEADRRAHFHRDVDALVATLPPDFRFISVRDGKIQTQSPDGGTPPNSNHPSRLTAGGTSGGCTAC